MAEEEIAAAASGSPAPPEHKRKLEDLESDAPAPELNGNSNSETESESVKKDGEDSVTGDEVAAADGPEPKRPRLEDKSADLVTKNGCQEERVDESKEAEDEPKEDEKVDELKAVEGETKEEEEESAGHVVTVENNTQSEEVQEQIKEAEIMESNDQAAADHQSGEAADKPSDNPLSENVQEQQELSKEEVLPPFAEENTTFENRTITRKMEVPNNKVGVLIGKAGDTIRSLQLNSGARIQIVRDVDADPHAVNRPVELIGTMENINRAEKLIKDVIAEADAGGSPSLVAKGYNANAAEGGEQIQIQVPSEKVGLIIGKGGETIKNLQTRSGARIQLIPPSEGDQSKGKTVRVTGDRKQVENARQMIMDVMNQNVRSSSLSSGYNQQTSRQRGPGGPQWGSRGTHSGQPTGYDYQQRGPYPSQNPPSYPPSAYGNYPQQPPPSRGSYGPGWEQRPPATMQGPPPQGGYDYYGGHSAPVPAPASSIHGHAPGPSPAPAMGPPMNQANYNYGQPHAPDYGQSTHYSHGAPPAQSYGHGYGDVKYENQGPMQHPYGGSQPPAYPQPGYGSQEQYGKAPPSYGLPSQGGHPQSYGQPRPNHPGDMPYQGPPVTPTPQQPYPPYAANGQVPQPYPPYGSVPSDGYSQPPPAASSAPGYSQQSGQPVPGYGQPVAQQVPPGYAQAAPPAGTYVSYPSSQPVYPEQPPPNTAGYGYQGATDPTYGGAPNSAYSGPPSGQPTYAQAAPTQPGYDQSMPPPQSGGYGNAAPVSAPAAYGKSASPQPVYPQYDSNQMYAAHR